MGENKEDRKAKKQCVIKKIYRDVSTYFLIAGSSCGLIPDRHIIPPGDVKLQSVAESILRGPWIEKQINSRKKRGKGQKC